MDRLRAHRLCSIPQISAVTRLIAAGTVLRSCRKRLSNWKCYMLQTSSVGSLSLVPPMPPANWVVFTVGSAEKMSQFFFMGHTNFFNIFKRLGTFQRLSVETRGWRVLDFEDNPVTEDEFKRQKLEILKGPLVVRDQGQPFNETWLWKNGECGLKSARVGKSDTTFRINQMRDSNELLEELWSQFVQAAGPMNSEVTWSSDDNV